MEYMEIYLKTTATKSQQHTIKREGVYFTGVPKVFTGHLWHIRVTVSMGMSVCGLYCGVHSISYVGIFSVTCLWLCHTSKVCCESFTIFLKHQSAKHEHDCRYAHFVLCRDHDDVIKWKHFPRYWPFVWGIHRSPVNSPHKGQRRGALMFSLIRT